MRSGDASGRLRSVEGRLSSSSRHRRRVRRVHGCGAGQAQGHDEPQRHQKLRLPLPRDWAHYRGLYVNGDNVVLSYTVGDCSVLELPGCVEKDGLVTITRTFKLGPSSRPLELLLCENIPDGVQQLSGILGGPAGI